LALLVIGVLCVGTVFAGLYDYAGWYGFNVILRRGASKWIAVTADDARLSDAMRLALRVPVPPAVPGPFSWRGVRIHASGAAVAQVRIRAAGPDAVSLTYVLQRPSWRQVYVPS